MDQQVLGGGIITLVTVVLWLVYLLPSWSNRRQFQASERNAVRLNQALRVLAETSETPDEVHLELSTRTALAQQKLARRALAEREQAALEQSRVDLERARQERAASRARPEARQARARHAMRVVLWTVFVLSCAIAGVGAFLWVGLGSSALSLTGLGVAAVSGLILRRMQVVAIRAAQRAAHVVPVPRVARPIQDVPLPVRTPWQPRSLPRPLTSATGSRASSVLDAAAAREALRAAAREDVLRERASQARPTPITPVRPAAQAPARRAAKAPTRPGTPDFAAMGYVDDAEIEEHVRSLLTRRASGQ